MTLEDLYTWLAPQMQNPEAVRMGSLDGQAEQFLALYEVSKDAGTPARICLGGPDCTHWDDMTVRLVLRWGQIPARGRGRSPAAVGAVLRPDQPADGQHPGAVCRPGRRAQLPGQGRRRRV